VPKSVTVVLSEGTLVITLHEGLSPAERQLAKSPTARSVQEFHRQLFASSSETLRQEIQRITGMKVRDATAQVEPTTGAVVQAFTTGTVVQVFCSTGAHRPETWSGDGQPTKETASRDGQVTKKTLARDGQATNRPVERAARPSADVTWVNHGPCRQFAAEARADRRSVRPAVVTNHRLLGRNRPCGTSRIRRDRLVSRGRRRCSTGAATRADCGHYGHRMVGLGGGMAS